MIRRVFIGLVGGALASALAPRRSAAQAYPTRPVTLVIPFPPGGGNDALGRMVTDKMSKSLGQQIVVDNRGGAGGTIATRAVARSAPDGARAAGLWRETKRLPTAFLRRVARDCDANVD
jgi:tripartite-type tricarboxylate transporter receptor subunit TctC